MAKHTNNKEINEMIDTVLAQGWRLQAGKGHVKVCPPDKSVPCVTIATTPSDHRAPMNVRAQLRRSGGIV